MHSAACGLSCTLLCQRRNFCCGAAYITSILANRPIRLFKRRFFARRKLTRERRHGVLRVCGLFRFTHLCRSAETGADKQAVLSIKQSFLVCCKPHSSLFSERRTNVSNFAEGSALRLNSFLGEFMLMGCAHSILQRLGIFAPLKITLRRNILPPERASPEYE